MTLAVEAVAFDCAEPEAVAGFWGSLLGWQVQEEDPGEFAVVPPAGGGAGLLFLPVPEGKQVKNRLHLDLRPDDQDTEVARAQELGARRVSVGQSDADSWVVLADPEGNEFCILRAR